ncbi:MAG: hypothetical protein ABEJ27_07600 [Halodesulfurarchaeum sp.]
MAVAIDHDVAWSVPVYAVNEIRELVEPVACAGGEGEHHEPAEAEVAVSGPGDVGDTCPSCGSRALYHHGEGEKAPCCRPRE